jgi:hypothetical protein
MRKPSVELYVVVLLSPEGKSLSSAHRTSEAAERAKAEAEAESGDSPNYYFEIDTTRLYEDE